MSTIRQEQVQNRLVAELSEMLRRELKDPRLGFITVTGAEITRDLRYAKVFISVLGDETKTKESLAALKSAVGIIRGEFARRAHLRVAPDITFHADEGIAHGARIFELLNQVKTAPKIEPIAEPFDTTEPEVQKISHPIVELEPFVDQTDDLEEDSTSAGTTSAVSEK